MGQLPKFNTENKDLCEQRLAQIKAKKSIQKSQREMRQINGGG